MTDIRQFVFAAGLVLLPQSSSALEQGDVPMWDAECQCLVSSGISFQEWIGKEWVPMGTSSTNPNKRVNFGGIPFYIEMRTNAEGEIGPEPYIGYDGSGLLTLERLNAVSNAGIIFCIEGKPGRPQPRSCDSAGFARPDQFRVSATPSLGVSSFSLFDAAGLDSPSKDKGFFFRTGAKSTKAPGS
jgi:hypothetical protein